LLASIIRARNPAGGAPLARRSTRAAVDILEGLIRQGIDRDTAEETADNPVAPRRPKAAYSSVLCAYIAHHKTTAVQEMLFACPRKAKEVAVVLRLKQFRPHEAMKALARSRRAPMQPLKARIHTTAGGNRRTATLRDRNCGRV
jgi:hypothetical protein